MTASIAADLTACATEPIRVPGAIQPHGYLFVLHESTLEVEQCSRNVIDAFACDPPTASHNGPVIDKVLGREALELVQAARSLDLTRARQIGRLTLRGELYDLLLHRQQQSLILELELAHPETANSTIALHSLARDFIGQLRPLQQVSEFCELAASHMRHMTGFGRILVYRFDEDGHGEVLGESIEDGYTSYRGHHFPASDIPPQARQLYETNHIRLIPDSNYEPSPLVPRVHPRTGEATDLSFAGLRSVSPVHLEYMRNMGTAASMSISIMVRNRLWGLISCHHHEPRHVPLTTRVASEHLGQLLSLQIEGKETYEEAEHGLQLRRLLVEMVAGVVESGNALEHLVKQDWQLRHFGNVSGAVVLSNGDCHSVGNVPTEDEVRGLAEWISASGHEVFATDRLHAEYPAAATFAESVGGVLAVSISQLHQNYVLWFRPEVVRTIQWAGNPAKPVEQIPGDLRIHPRKSFETWRERVRGRSVPWRDSEVRSAAELRHALLNIVLRRAEEVAELAGELGRINRELESFSYSVSHDLRAPLRHITGYADLIRENEAATLSERGRRYIENIKESARFAGTLVDDLLAFSQMGRSTLRPVRVDVGAMVNGIIANVQLQQGMGRVQWKVGTLPIVHADPVFMQVIMDNLIGNAVKYSRSTAEPVVEIWGETNTAAHVISVRDNGVGFDMKYVGKLFGIFQRLHRIEEFEGTGIGLASVRRAVERHGGTVSAHGELGKGAMFTVNLPCEQTAATSDANRSAGEHAS